VLSGKVCTVQAMMLKEMARVVTLKQQWTTLLLLRTMSAASIRLTGLLNVLVVLISVIDKAKNLKTIEESDLSLNVLHHRALIAPLKMFTIIDLVAVLFRLTDILSFP